MRILMLSQFYHPIVGGTEQHVRTLSLALVALGHDVAVVTIQHAGQASFAMDQGVRVYRIRASMQRLPGMFGDNKRQHAPPLPDLELVLALRQIIAVEHPHIVHAHNWLVRSFLPLKTWSKARLVVTLHDYKLVCAKETLMHHGLPCSGPGLVKCLGCAVHHYGLVKGVPTVLGNWAMGMPERAAVDMFIPVSQATAVGNGLMRGDLPFQVIPNFISDTMTVPSVDAEPYLAQLPAEDFLLFVGTFSRSKGLDILLQAYAKLTNAPPLVLIGYPTPEWSIPTADCTDKVFIFADWPHEAVMGAWSRCSIGLIPSTWAEPFGIVALEAMSRGKPVIASRIGGLADIVIDGETGFLVAPGDPDVLQKAIQCLLDDPLRRERMGQMGRDRVVAFQAKSVVPRIEQIYQELVAA